MSVDGNDIMQWLWLIYFWSNPFKSIDSIIVSLSLSLLSYYYCHHHYHHPHRYNHYSLSSFLWSAWVSSFRRGNLWNKALLCTSMMHIISKWGYDIWFQQPYTWDIKVNKSISILWITQITGDLVGLVYSIKHMLDMCCTILEKIFEQQMVALAKIVNFFFTEDRYPMPSTVNTSAGVSKTLVISCRRIDLGLQEYSGLNSKGLK